MIYLTQPTSRDNWPRLAGAGLGIMRTPDSGNAQNAVMHFPCWAADNGCFNHGDSFDLAAYLTWLERMAPMAEHCLFATAPDVVGNAAATWERSRDVLPMIRELGYKPALVAQDGWDSNAVDWAAFDCLFIGGTDKFKMSDQALALIREAKERGKWVHVGRVNSWARLKWCKLAGADSADGTAIVFNPGRYVPEIMRWAHRLRMQPLPLYGAPKVET